MASKWREACRRESHRAIAAPRAETTDECSGQRTRRAPDRQPRPRASPRSRGAAGSRRRWRAGATSAVYHLTDSWRCERSAFCILGGARPQEARPIRELKEDATTNSSGGYRHTGWQAPVPACGSHVVIAAANETRPRSRRADGGIAPVNPRPRASVTPRSWTGGGLGGPDRCQ